MYPITLEDCREFPVSASDLSKILGNEFAEIMGIDWFKYRIGERVKVIERIEPIKGIKPLYVFRYITKISPVIALLGDENFMIYTLEIFNNAEL
jgi:hypothetical protein